MGYVVKQADDILLGHVVKQADDILYSVGCSLPDIAAIFYLAALIGLAILIAGIRYARGTNS